MKNLLSALFILIFLSATLFAQDNAAKNKEKKIKEPKPEKVKETSSSSSSEEDEEGDKNLGAAFNGAWISISGGMNYYYGDIARYRVFPRPSQFDEHIRSAFKVSLGREIKWGMGAQASFQKGSLIGTRKTGKQSSTVTFENQFYDVSFEINYLLNKALFKHNEYNRFYLYGYIGVSSVWYRSYLYDTETLNTKDFEGFIERPETQGVSQKNLLDKDGNPQTFAIPVGMRLNFRYNHKMDIHLDCSLTSTFTDRLDAFSRNFTAKDKYAYVGLGVTYNFNRTKDDAPKKREKQKKDTTDSADATSEKDSDIKSGILSRNKSNNKRGKKDDELLNIRLKLFETQLKLFEMQYLIGQ